MMHACSCCGHGLASQWGTRHEQAGKTGKSFPLSMQAAIEACYAIQPAVHRLWKPIRGELDDYIFNPKPSGYQSLHSAVLGAPLRPQTCIGHRACLLPLVPDC